MLNGTEDGGFCLRSRNSEMNILESDQHLLYNTRSSLRGKIAGKFGEDQLLCSESRSRAFSKLNPCV